MWYTRSSPFLADILTSWVQIWGAYYIRWHIIFEVLRVVGDASDDGLCPIQTGRITLGWAPCLLISWSLLFMSSYRWPMIVRISPVVPTRLADATTLRAASSYRCRCLPARQPRRRNLSCDTCRRTCWLSCTVLKPNGNSRSRVYIVAVEVVINGVKTVIKNVQIFM